MKRVLLPVLLFVGLVLRAQNYKVPQLTKSVNYIYTVTPQYPFQINALDNVLAGNQIVTNEKIKENITYFDGLGRPLEEIGIRQTPGSNDIISFHKYDSYGRESIKYLPFAMTNNGSYNTAYNTVPDYYAFSFYQGYRNLGIFGNQPFDNIPLDPEPYSKTIFDNSPLNRVVEQGAPGEAWQPNNNVGHTIKTAYTTNAPNEGIPLFYAVNNVLLKGADYSNGALYKTIIKGENWQPTQTNLKDHTFEEFKNKQGQLVLKRVYNNNQVHDTYYVYDYSGNLTFVLPPKIDAATVPLTTINTLLNDLSYQYKYDYKNRLIEKKLPGKETESIVYNNLNQPILTQDAVQKAKNEWIFTKYDAFGRIAYTGKAVSTANTTRESIQNEVTALTDSQWVTQGTNLSSFGGTSLYYNNGAYPNSTSVLVSVSEIMAINYYDTYVTRPSGAPNSIVIMESQTGELNTTNVKGLLTASKIKVLDVAGTNVWITKLNYYDNKARLVYIYSENTYLETIDFLEIKLDFTGKKLKTKATHKKSGVTTSIIDNFIYDHAERLKAHTQCIGDANMGYVCAGNIETQLDLNLTGTINTNQIAGRSITVKNATILPNTILSINTAKQELIVFNSFDELGQLKNKKIGGPVAAAIENSAGLQTIDYKFNIRGWLKNINEIENMGTDLFAFNINYNDITDTSKKLFNGNISQTQWKTANTDKSLKGYVYEYDALNRLTTAVDNSVINPSRYNESTTYDKNGNILSLIRKGNTDVNALTFGTMDNLAYTYNSGNRLTKVEDSSGSTEGFNNGSSGSNTDYTYDLNGNMLTDANKNITEVKYNYLNLPTKITFTSGTIQYIYDAAGVKLRKIVTPGVTTDYAGAFIYEGTTLKFFSQREGYVAKNADNFDYIYQYKDHLGNVRLSFDKNLSIVEENNYYPFGLKQKGYNNIPNYLVGKSQAEKHKYNGKELQEELGLNMYDYGARNYDPALGRWMNIDPLAENSRRFSPYIYALNNPLLFIDPDGMSAVGADGLTNEQWIEASRPGADPNLTAKYKADNREEEFRNAKKKTVAIASNLEEGEGEGDEPPVSFFGKRDGPFWHNVFNKEFKKYAWTEGDGIFRVYGHGWLQLLWDDTGKVDEKVFNPKVFNDKMAKKSRSWAKAMKEHKEITLVLYVCASGSPDGRSIAQKISKAYDNVTVIAFDGYVMYSPTGDITGISKEWSVDGTSDNLGEQVTFKGGKEVPGSRTKKLNKI